MPGNAPFDAAETANALAEAFFSASDAVDHLRLGLPPVLRDQQNADDSPEARLRQLSDALESQAQLFTAQAIGATLARVQPDLERLQTATQQAAAQLSRLHRVETVIELATSLLGLGTAVGAGDPATILAAVQNLAAQLSLPS